jgi:hypothetical protein
MYFYTSRGSSCTEPVYTQLITTPTSLCSEIIVVLVSISLLPLVNLDSINIATQNFTPTSIDTWSHAHVERVTFVLEQ